jgi:hypothetical protein
MTRQDQLIVWGLLALQGSQGSLALSPLELSVSQGSLESQYLVNLL